VLLLLITLGKAVPVTGIVAAGGHQLPMALRVGGLLGQSGEFSFVLAAVGLELGVVGNESFSQAMGAVVLSILAAGPLAAATARAGDWLDRRAPATTQPAETSPAAEMRRHTIVAGYGAVGRTVARVLEARGIPWVAVDADYPMVRGALANGLPIIYGNAGTPSVLDVAGVDQASTVVFAMDDPLAIRQAVRYARQRNERLHIVARAHSAQEEGELRRLGAARVITAERELGNELLRHTLWRYGVSEREIDAILRRRA
jgi:CPA2 family monovalent cation:H+ antiporter-2